MTLRAGVACSYACSILLGVCLAGAPLQAEDFGTVPKNAEAAILRNPGTPDAGAEHATVILVEYFDYNCPFCKKLNPALAALLNADPNVALVHKDWPILSDESHYAAEFALAAVWQGKYPAAHDALMGASHLASHVQIETLLQAAGIDMPTLKKDRDSHAVQIAALLQRNDTEARALGIRGTPGLLVGRHVINGVYDLAGLEQAVAVARADR